MSNSLKYFLNVEDVFEARLQDLGANDGLG
jgi:hypothetical protein